MIRHPRTRERGSVIFVVLMVLTVLSAIGVFAARSAGLNQRTSGYSRQLTEGGYIADYGLIATIPMFRANPPKPPTLPETNPCLAPLHIDGTSCRQYTCADYQKQLSNIGSSISIFDTGSYDLAGMCSGAANTGNLGSAVPRPEFHVELTDLIRAPPRPGFRADKSNNWQVTLTSYAQVKPVRPDAPAATEVDQAKSSRMSRAFVVFYKEIQ